MKSGLKRPSWDERFMFEAYSSAIRSSCKYIQTGAVIVKDKRIIASGYNGAPPGIVNCLERGCRKDDKGIAWDKKGLGNCRGAHAEINAMAQISRADLIGTTMYTVFFPCSACAKSIVGNGIKEVVYSKIYKEIDSLTKELMQEAGIILRQLKIDVDKQFDLIKNVQKQPSIL